jgi:hypothetical protein
VPLSEVCHAWQRRLAMGGLLAQYCPKQDVPS